MDFAGTYGSFAIAVTGNTLSATVGRPPSVTLISLREDVFFDAQDPSHRFVFERANDKVAALRVVDSAGTERRLRRSPP
ncbi:MAG: hypothetical protein ABW034_17515 [Steroidobacteraceae bacterium]